MGLNADKASRNFQQELASIKDPKIKEFVLRCFDEVCPDYFWTRAASSSNKYHPSFVNGDGGLVRHVKYACYWADRLCRQLDGDGYQDHTPNRDVVIAALLLHDCMKDGDPAKEPLGRNYQEIGGCHGVDMAQAIWTRVLKGKAEFKEQLLILYGIAGHMSRWTCGKGKKFTQYERFMPQNLKSPLARKTTWIVSIADYCAAQRFEDVVPDIAKHKVT